MQLTAVALSEKLACIYILYIHLYASRELSRTLYSGFYMPIIREIKPKTARGIIYIYKLVHTAEMCKIDT